MKSIDIDDVTYRVRALPTRKAMALLCRVLKMSAPAFADVASLADAKRAAFGVGISALMGDLDEKVVTDTLDELAAVTVVVENDGANERPLKPILDLHFEGRIVQMFAWAQFALEVTYGPLIESLKAKAPAQAEKSP